MQISFDAGVCLHSTCALKMSTCSLTEDFGMFGCWFSAEEVHREHNIDAVPGGLNEGLSATSLLFLPAVSTEFIKDPVTAFTPGQLLIKKGNAIIPERLLTKQGF